jgi:hypothetical protein
MQTCRFAIFASWDPYFRNHRWPVRHAHDEGGKSVTITGPRLNRPRRSSSHKVKRHRKIAYWLYGKYEKPPPMRKTKGIKTCPFCNGVNPEYPWLTYCKYCYSDLTKL